MTSARLTGDRRATVGVGNRAHMLSYVLTLTHRGEVGEVQGNGENGKAGQRCFREAGLQPLSARSLWAKAPQLRGQVRCQRRNRTAAEEAAAAAPLAGAHSVQALQSDEGFHLLVHHQEVKRGVELGAGSTVSQPAAVPKQESSRQAGDALVQKKRVFFTRRGYRS